MSDAHGQLNKLLNFYESLYGSQISGYSSTVTCQTPLPDICKVQFYMMNRVCFVFHVNIHIISQRTLDSAGNGARAATFNSRCNKGLFEDMVELLTGISHYFL